MVGFVGSKTSILFCLTCLLSSSFVASFHTGHHAPSRSASSVTRQATCATISSEPKIANPRFRFLSLCVYFSVYGTDVTYDATVTSRRAHTSIKMASGIDTLPLAMQSAIFLGTMSGVTAGGLVLAGQLSCSSVRAEDDLRF
eukprot:231607-Rhodomonas_salina.1